MNESISSTFACSQFHQHVPNAAMGVNILHQPATSRPCKAQVIAYISHARPHSNKTISAAVTYLFSVSWIDEKSGDSIFSRTPFRTSPAFTALETTPCLSPYLSQISTRRGQLPTPPFRGEVYSDYSGPVSTGMRCSEIPPSFLYCNPSGA
jgi:hypothetical protein